jgi:polysaccharide biosynthesis protein PslF
VRVLFITGEYPPMQGGVGDYTREVGLALARLGTNVHVLTRINAGDIPSSAQTGYDPHVYPVLQRTGWNLFPQSTELIRRLDPDAIHIQYQSAAYGLHPAVNYLPWFLRRRRSRNRPTIYVTFHDLRVPYMFPKAGPLRWRAVVDLARYSDAAVVTNPTDYARLTAANTRLAGHVEPIPIGSNISPVPPVRYDRTAQRARWGCRSDDWLLAYFGFLNANKGGETLVRALAELARAGKPARLLLIGGQVGASDPTNTAYLAIVKGLIEELGLADCVCWTGFTSPAEVSANLLAADCAALPYREGASLRHGSLMAALAHGLPVITTAAPALRPLGLATGRDFPALIDGESVRLVPPEDPVALADAVTAVMTDPALRSRLARGALDLARRFEWDAIARQHLELYGQRLSGSPPASSVQEA